MQALITCLICLAMSTRNILVKGIVYGHSLGVPHLDDTHLNWQDSALSTPQRVTDPHSPLLASSADTGCLGGSKILAIPTIQPSSLEICSPRSVLRSVFFLASNHCKTASSSGSSFWAVAQLVTCISTRTHPAVTWYFLCFLLVTLNHSRVFSFCPLGGT